MLNRFLKIKSNTKKVTPTIITYIILILLDIITLQKYIKKYANAYEYANTKQKTPRFNMQHLKKKKTFTKKLFFKFLKNLNHRKNILKITKINWQTTKKKLTKIHVPNMQTKDYSLKTKTLFNLSAHSKINKTNVNFFKKYRLKKRFNLDTIKKRYQYWLKRNEYQRIFFKQKITPQYARKVIQLHKLVGFLFMSNQKKKTIKIVKKLNKLRTYVKIAHIRLPNYANITTHKSILQNTRTDMFKIYKRRNFSQKINYVWSNYKLNKPVDVCTYVDTIKYQITIPTKFTKKTKPIEVIILKKTLHKQIFKNFFYYRQINCITIFSRPLLICFIHRVCH